MAIIAPLFAKSSTFYNPCIYVIANKKWVFLSLYLHAYAMYVCVGIRATQQLLDVSSSSFFLIAKRKLRELFSLFVGIIWVHNLFAFLI